MHTETAKRSRCAARAPVFISREPEVEVGNTFTHWPLTEAAMDSESDDILTQALNEAEIREEWGSLTQEKYIVETEPITEDSESDDCFNDFLAILKEKDVFVNESETSAMKNAVDVSDMLDFGGPTGVGYQRRVKKKDLQNHAAQVPGCSEGPASPNKERSRFATVSDDVMLQRRTEFVPPNTLRKNKWALNVFKKWKNEFLSDTSNAGGKRGDAYKILRNPTRDLQDYSDAELITVLCVFVIALKKENGEDYPGESVLSIVCALQRHLRLEGRHVDILNDDAFSDLKTTIDNTMQEKCTRGVGVSRRQASVITPENEEILFEKGILGNSTPQALVDTIFWTVGLNFALRGGEEHRKLTFRNFDINTDSNGQRYLNYTESVSKTYRGGLSHRNKEPHSARAYEVVDNPKRCPVRLFEGYRDKLPKQRRDDIFYFRPLSQPKGDIWFANQGIGHNKLDSVVRRLMTAAGISGYFTNHSLRASTATRLYNAGLNEQIIKEQTGHRSLAVESYKRTSDKQKQQVSNILCGLTSATKRPKTGQCPAETISGDVAVDVSAVDREEASRFTLKNCTGANVTINNYYNM